MSGLCPNSLLRGTAEGTAKGSGLKATLPGGRSHDMERGSGVRVVGAKTEKHASFHDRGGEAF